MDLTETGVDGAHVQAVDETRRSAPVHVFLTPKPLSVPAVAVARASQ